MMHGISDCCRYCTERYEACHDYCEKYLTAQNEWHAFKDNVKKAKSDEYELYKIEAIRKDKIRRSKDGRKK